MDCCGGGALPREVTGGWPQFAVAPTVEEED